MLRSKEYWQKRFALLNEQLLTKVEVCLPSIDGNYQAAIANIGEEINRFYAKFAQNNELSFVEAKRLLTSDERKAFRMTVDEYIIKGETLEVSKEWLKELENASLVYRVSRLQALQVQMRQQVEVLAAAKDKTISTALQDVYTEGYYRSVYEIQKGLGVGSTFARLDEKRIAKTLAKPWAPDGKNFSARIWGNDRSVLLHKLQTTFTQGLIRGVASQNIITDIAKTLYASQKAVANLVLTESAFFASAARADCYKELGVESYEFLATLDSKTCSVCADMDGRVFKFKEYQVGLTAPPLHPRDRCTTVPYFDDEFTDDEKRASRDPITGKYYTVPADMMYPKWKKSIDEKHGMGSYARERIKAQSVASDKLQHQKYRAILGKDMPKSFAKFQDLKYNNGERWQFVQLDYNRQKRLLDNPKLALPNAKMATAAEAKFTGYLFNPDNAGGYSKGKAFTSRLGYNISNFNELRETLLKNLSKYPTKIVREDQHGIRYEQFQIIYGLKDKPANVVVGWNVKDGKTHMTSCYIKEVKL